MLNLKRGLCLPIMQPVKNDDSDNSDQRAKRAGFDGGGGGGYDGTMNERITKLETLGAQVVLRLDRVEHRLDGVEYRLDGVERRLDGVERRLEKLDQLLVGLIEKVAEYRLETKRDIDQAIKWIVGVMLAISMAAITIITFVLNYATPKAVPAAQPIVIYATPTPVVRAP